MLPYYLVHKLVRHRGEVDGLRGGERGGAFRRLTQKTLYAWFRHVENRMSFGFGLSLIVVAERLKTDQRPSPSRSRSASRFWER